jgi:hypothetical protein
LAAAKSVEWPQFRIIVSEIGASDLLSVRKDGVKPWPISQEFEDRIIAQELIDVIEVTPGSIIQFKSRVISQSLGETMDEGEFLNKRSPRVEDCHGEVGQVGELVKV